MANKRIQKELKDLSIDKNFVSVDEKDGSYTLLMFMNGPEGSIFEGNKYKIRINFNRTNYPFKPPEVNFVSKIFHPNVGSSGNICVDFLSSEWSPVYTIQKMIDALKLLLITPNPDSPLNSDAANKYRNNQALYKETNDKYAASQLLF